MDDSDGDQLALAAGDFSAWMAEIEGALRGEHGSDVPCDGCTACCTASQFVLISPDETDSLAHIPAELLFPAPRLPRGHMLLGYDGRGHCPMLIDDQCSIYDHRPLTCRTYDCRIFPAAGIEPDDETQVLISLRARRWQFTYSEEVGRELHDAVRAAATFLANHPDVLPGGALTNATHLAIGAIEAHSVFLEDVDPDPNVVRVELRRRQP